jgi:cobalt-zinc-cadmium resistance protein CzcA
MISACWKAQPNALRSLCNPQQGAADVKIEQTSGLPFLEVTPRKDVIARYGLNVADVLDAVQIAIGGREAGLVFEG